MTDSAASRASTSSNRASARRGKQPCRSVRKVAEGREVMSGHGAQLARTTGSRPARPPPPLCLGLNHKLASTRSNPGKVSQSRRISPRSMTPAMIAIPRASFASCAARYSGQSRSSASSAPHPTSEGIGGDAPRYHSCTTSSQFAPKSTRLPTTILWSVKERPVLGCASELAVARAVPPAVQGSHRADQGHHVD